MRVSPRQVVIALLVVAGFAVTGYGAARLVGFEAPVAPDLAVEQRLMCPQCQGVRLDVCDQPICDDMRADIRQRLASGEGQDAIVTGYAAIYGPAVLASAGATDRSAPVPWLFVLIGLTLLASLALARSTPAPIPPPRHQDRPDVGPVPSPIPNQLVDRELADWRSGR